MTSPAFYTRTFARALVRYADDFMARYLDADDVAYIENIRERGCVGNGSLAEPIPTTAGNGHNGAMLEELGYWHTRFAVEPGVERVPASRRNVEDAAAKALGREKYEAIRRRKAERREADRAAMRGEQRQAQAEWKREQAEFKKEREARLKRMLQADLEWESEWERTKHRQAFHYGAPRDTRFNYGFNAADHRAGRHYVPQWKREEQRTQEWAATAERPEHDWSKLLKPKPPAPPEPPPQAYSRQPPPPAPARKPMREIDAILDKALNDNYRENLKETLREILIPKAMPRSWNLSELAELTGCADITLLRHVCVELIHEGKALEA